LPASTREAVYSRDIFLITAVVDASSRLLALSIEANPFRASSTVYLKRGVSVIPKKKREGRSIL
jgi:hypothetical protein